MKRQILVVGLGNMGGALLRGLDNTEIGGQHQLLAYDTHLPKKQQFADFANIRIVETIESVWDLDLCVVLCIKPHDLRSLATLISGRLTAQSMVVSVLAGTSLDNLANELKFAGPIVRAMPNIAATIGQAATAMCRNDNVTAVDETMAEAIFAGVGVSAWTKESLMDTVTGLSGSGPAYIFMVIEALTDGGVKMGLPRDLAAKLATQTVLGAAGLVKETGIHPAILKDQVTTPAGTTISALHELEQRGLRSMFVSAVETATQRSCSLGKNANPLDIKSE